MNPKHPTSKSDLARTDLYIDAIAAPALIGQGFNAVEGADTTIWASAT